MLIITAMIRTFAHRLTHIYAVTVNKVSLRCKIRYYIYLRDTDTVLKIVSADQYNSAELIIISQRDVVLRARKWGDGVRCWL